MRRFCKKTVALKRLKGLIGKEAPSIFVITDKHDGDLEKQLHNIGVKFCVFEAYKSTTGRYVYRTFGEYPIVPEQEAHCRAHPHMPNLMEVIGAFQFTKTKRGGVVDVGFEELLTRWKIVNDNQKQYLQFYGRSNPLSPNSTYYLIRDKRHKYYMKRN